MSATKLKSFHVCPCCEKAEVGDFEICRVCGWENDYQQGSNPDMRGGANHMSLEEAKEAYRNGQKVE